MQTGKEAQAIPHLKASLTIDEDGSLHYQLMQAARAVGDTPLAAGSLKKYQQIQKASEAAKNELKEEAQITAPEPR